MNFSSTTHIGLERQENQDYLAHLNTGEGDLFIVCDGLSGLPNGALASKTAVESILSDFSGRLYDPVGLLCKSLVNANEIVVNASTNPLGTTVVAVYLQDGTATAAWCGDSRIYHFRDHDIQWMTQDHNVLHDILNKGKASGGLFLNPQAITRYLGMEEYPKGDYCQYDVESGDCILLCSDGLHGFIMEPDIIHAVMGHPPEKASEILEKKLLSEKIGAPDNFTWYIINI